VVKPLNFALAVVTVAASLLCIVRPIDKPSLRPPTREFACGMFDFITFSHINSLISVSRSKVALGLEDVPLLSDEDSCYYIFETIRKPYLKDQSILRKIYEAVSTEVWTQQFFQLFNSSLLFVPPLALKSILSQIDARDPTSDTTPKLTFGIDPTTAVVLLLVVPCLKSICEGQVWSRGRRIQMRVQAALVSLIYHKTLHVDIAAVQEGPGSLNNLIGVDANEASNFCNYLQWMWCPLYEISVCMTLLFIVMGISALGGICLILL
jgi:hypothetical protein